MARSIHPTYDAADRYARRMTRRQRPDAPTRRDAIALSMQEAA